MDRKGSEVPPRVPAMVGRLGGLEALPKGPGARSLSWGPGGVVMPSWRAGRSWEALPENQEGLERSGEVGRPVRRVGRGWEAHLESREGSIGKEEYGRPYWRTGKGPEAFTEGR